MNRKTQYRLGMLALLLAGGSGYAVFATFERLEATVTVPVPGHTIPAGTQIAPAMLAPRRVPRALLSEPVYATADELVGQVAQVTLPPGIIVYRAFTAPPARVVVAVPVRALSTPTPSPTPAATPRLDVRVVTGTHGLPLNVRSAPGERVLGAVAEGDLVVVLHGPALDTDGAAWYRITQHGDLAVAGWVLGRYLMEALP